ncbi:DUF4859 domain-containing protein [Fulvivirga maritima]|uniref:DUF4859 domain-containing protein n=1 Tax=Fulvivirga maritima TaxID=2904247 RepID=UPI001F2991F6|nr:DUF4859 domain-containing protein [Fulvivirga maritima]UII26163.1 DUF4859 domain-containing protein [Fulvivirga maritima]
MKNIKYYFLALLVLFMASCNEELEVDEAASEMPEETDLAFDHYGFQTAKLITTEEAQSYNTVIKYAEESALTVQIAVDSSLLNSYNALYGTEYQVLSPEYYSLPASVNLEQEETDLEIVFQSSALMEDLGIEEASNLVLPIKLIAQDNGDLQVNDQMTQLLIHVGLEVPTVSFTTYEYRVAAYDTTELASMSITGYYNMSEIDVEEMSWEISEENVDVYNNAQGTEYPILPVANYSFNSVSVNQEEQSISFDFDLNATGLSLGTYLLPVSFSSDEYEVDMDTDYTYFLVTINQSALDFVATYEFSVAQPADNEYTALPIELNIEEVATALGVSVDDLEGNLTVVGITPEGGLYSGDYTASNGFWYTGEGEIISYGEEGSALYVEYIEDNEVFNIGQFPDAASDLDEYHAYLALSYEGRYVRYNFNLTILPDFVATYDFSVDQPVQTGYETTAINFDFAELASHFGTTEDELRAGYTLYSLSEAGYFTDVQTANNGFWYADNGEVVNYGTEGCSLFVEYSTGEDGLFTIGQFESGNDLGDSFNVSILLRYEQQMARFNFTLNIEE